MRDELRKEELTGLPSRYELQVWRQNALTVSFMATAGQANTAAQTAGGSAPVAVNTSTGVDVDIDQGADQDLDQQNDSDIDQTVEWRQNNEP